MSHYLPLMSNNLFAKSELEELLEIIPLESNHDLHFLEKGDIISGYFVEGSAHPYLLVGDNSSQENRHVLTLSRRIGVTHNTPGHTLEAVEQVIIQYNSSASQISTGDDGSIVSAQYQTRHFTNYTGDTSQFNSISTELKQKNLWNVPH